MGGKLGVTSDLLQLYSLYEGNGEKQGDLVTIWPFHPGKSPTFKKMDFAYVQKLQT